ncbi:MAG: DUF2059 domain-containing protein [Flavobacterium sp.]|nr:DUF2059 domain-containing protein [Flavobacterium sp.]
MRKLILAFVLLFAVQFTFAQDEALRKDIMKVIEASGSAAQMKAAKDQILPLIPADKQAAFLVEFDASMPAYYDKIVQIYIDNYTKEDIQAMLKFYESPVGKKITARAEAVTSATMTAAQQWGQGLQPMMMKYMQ